MIVVLQKNFQDVVVYHTEPDWLNLKVEKQSQRRIYVHHDWVLLNIQEAGPDISACVPSS